MSVAMKPGATTFTVTSTADTDGTTCVTATPCTLRQAINASNNAGGTNTIGFAIQPADLANPTPQTIDGLLSPVLVSLRARYPAIETSLVEGSNDFLLEQLQTGAAHVAIAALPQQHSFESQPLFMGYLHAVVPECQTFTSGKSAEVGALADQPLLLLRKGFMTRKVFDRACAQAGMRPRVILESDSTQTLLALANAGYGIAIVSSAALRHRLAMEGSRLVALTLDGQALGQMISAVWDPARARSAVLEPFLRELAEHAVPGISCCRSGSPPVLP